MIEEETYFNPFPGLRAFEEDEEYLFFGREKQIDDLLNKLDKTHFLAVIGTSGSGKSSLVKSGLLPSLHSGFIRGVGKGWRIGVFRPGDNPIGNLASCLCSEEFVVNDNEDYDLQPIIESVLRRSDEGIANVIDQFLNKLPENILLVADQFEELFRFSKYEKTSNKGTRDSVLFINLLLAAIKDKNRRIYVVFTMRSDFLGNCTEFRGFPEAINEGQYLIPRMTREEIKLAITGPVAVSGAEISSQLVTMFLNEVGDNPDQLPILQHALMRTCDYWSKNTNRAVPISIEHYESIGRMELALSNHADEAYNELTAEQKVLCASLFKALTEIGTNSGGVRRPTKLSELCELLAVKKDVLVPIIDVFRQRGRSFLMPPLEIELNDDSVIDISHESLMRVWLRLVKWFKEESDSTEIYLGLCQAAILYNTDKAGLYRDPELQIALKWKDSQQPSELWASRYNDSYSEAMSFMKESEKQFYFEIEQAQLAAKRKKRRTRLFILFLSIAFVFSIFFGWQALKEKKIALVSQQKAIEASKMAKESEEKAKQSESAARKSSVTASQEKEKAVIAQKIALGEADRANRLAKLAEQKEKEANENRLQAEKSAINAITQQKNAEKSAQEAKVSKEEAERLKNLADARYEAILAIKKLENKEIKEGVERSLIAQEKSLANGGDERVDVIYEALSKSLNESGKAQLTIDNDFGLRKITAHPTKNNIVYLNENSQLTFAELTNTNRLKEFKSKNEINVESFCYSSDGNYLITSNKQNLITLFKLGPDGLPSDIIADILLTEKIYDLKNLPNNSFIVLTESGITFYKIEGDLIKQNDNFQKIVVTNANQIETNDKGTIIAYSFLNELNLLMLSNLEIGEKEKISFNQLITSIEISNEKNIVAIGLANGNIRILKLTKSFDVIEDITLSNHSTKITKLKFVENSKELLLLSSSLDNTVGIINIDDLMSGFKDAKKGVKLKGHKLWINDLSLSFDKKYFFTASEDKTIRFWFVNPNDIVNILKENKEE